MFTRSKKKREEDKLRNIRSAKESLESLYEESDEDSQSSLESVDDNNKKYTELEFTGSTQARKFFTETEDTLPFVSKIKSEPRSLESDFQSDLLKSEELKGEQKLLESEQIQQLITHNNELQNALRLAHRHPIDDQMALAPEVLDAITRIGKTTISIGDLPTYQADQNESIHTWNSGSLMSYRRICINN